MSRGHSAGVKRSGWQEEEKGDCGWPVCPEDTEERKIMAGWARQAEELDLHQEEAGSR